MPVVVVPQEEGLELRLELEEEEEGLEPEEEVVEWLILINIEADY